MYTHLMHHHSPVPQPDVRSGRAPGNAHVGAPVEAAASPHGGLGQHAVGPLYVINLLINAAHVVHGPHSPDSQRLGLEIKGGDSLQFSS